MKISALLFAYAIQTNATKVKATSPEVIDYNVPTTLTLDYLQKCANIQLPQKSCLVESFMNALSSPEDLLNVPIVTPYGNFTGQELYNEFQAYLDADSDGVISPEELELGRRLLDSNKDGIISLEELAFAESYIMDRFSFMIPGFLNQANFEDNLFSNQLQLYDLDEDGILSNEEKEKAIEVLKLFYQEIYPSQEDLFLQLNNLKDDERFSQIFNLLDLNSDGDFNGTDMAVAQSMIKDLSLKTDLLVNQAQSMLNNLSSNEFKIDQFTGLNLTLNGTSFVINDAALNNMISDLNPAVSLQIQHVVEEYLGISLNNTDALDETKLEAFQTLDLNDDGMLNLEDISAIGLMLLGMFEESIYPGQIPFPIDGNYSLMDNINVSLAYSIFMDDPRISDEQKEIFVSLTDFDGDGVISNNDIDQGTALLVEFYNKFSNQAHEGRSNIAKEKDEKNLFKCELPFPQSMLMTDVAASSALHHCNTNDFEVNPNEVSETIVQLQQIFGATECITELCVDETQKKIVWDWLESCANIELINPTPRNHFFFDMASDTQTDSTLQCMLEFAMSSKPQNFDFNIFPIIRNPVDKCFPYDFTEMEHFCASSLGPTALRKCLDTKPVHEHMWEDNFFSFSYDYDLTYSFSYDYGFSYNYENPDDHKKDENAIYIDQFCTIMAELNTEKGRECLLPVCESIQSFSFNNEKPSTHNDDKEVVRPTSMPSIAPLITSDSMMPSIAPTRISMTPSIAPTHAPSLRSDVSLVTVNKVEAKFQASVSIENLSKDDIPKSGPELVAVVEVLQNALTKNLPPGSLTRILKIGGISVIGLSRRRLDDSIGVEVEFEVIKMIDCDGNDCTDAMNDSNDFYLDAKDQLGLAISSGSFETAIKEAASTSGVSMLEDIEVDDNSFLAAPLTTAITDEQKNEENPKDDDNYYDDDEENTNSEKSGACLFQVTRTLIFGFVFNLALNVVQI